MISEPKEPFEKIIEQLESVVQELEQGGLPLEEALARFEKGVHLAREGANRLADVERRIEEILEDNTVRSLHTSSE